MGPVSSYGAINNDDDKNKNDTVAAATASGDEEDPNEFKESNIYYLKEPSRTMKERFMKLLLLGLPVVIAILIIGTAAFYMFQDFDHLYPGPNGDPKKHYNDNGVDDASSQSGIPRGPNIGGGGYKRGRAPSTESSSSSGSAGELPPRGPNVVSSSSSSGDADCSLHEKCYKLGLAGSCCPTDAGTFLSCC